MIKYTPFKLKPPKKKIKKLKPLRTAYGLVGAAIGLVAVTSLAKALK